MGCYFACVFGFFKLTPLWTIPYTLYRLPVLCFLFVMDVVENELILKQCFNIVEISNNIIYSRNIIPSQLIYFYGVFCLEELIVMDTKSMMIDIATNLFQQKGYIGDR